MFDYDFNLRAYDIIVVNTSAGKDSQVMLDVVYKLAKAQGVEDRIVAVHCDLGTAEWAGTEALAREQAARYGVPFYVVRRPKGGLLHQVEHERKMWPSASNRYCTSDQKRDQVTPLITRLVEAHLLATTGRRRPRKGAAPVQVLNCIGLRAQESLKRAQEPVIKRDDRASSGVREITRWLPIHAWTEAEVWDRIRETNVPHHRAYDLGMPRLSCCFCIYAPEPALLIAGHHNRALLDECIRIERAINHTFRSVAIDHDAPLVQIAAKLDAGWVPTGAVAAWGDCGGGM